MDDQLNKKKEIHELDDDALEDISGGTWRAMMDQAAEEAESDILFDNEDVTFSSAVIITIKG